MPVLGDNPRKRGVVLVVLLAGLFAFCVVAGGYLNQCPNPDCISADYDTYVGTSVTVYGNVVETTPLRISVQTRNGPLQLDLVGVDRPLERGSRVGVSGTLRQDHAIVVSDLIVHKAQNRVYMYAVSLFAGFLVFGFVVRNWRFDREKLVLTPRGES